MYDIDSGEQVFRASYDAWGRQVIEQNDIDLSRGYCGHDMLSDYDLIDMGGRVYDPVIGRFLSCDNYVQEPDNSQNFNRYSYCLNNPLRYTDPDGEFWWIVAGIALGGAVNWAMNGAQFNAKGLEYFGVGALGTAAVVGGSVIGTPLMGALAGGFVVGAGNNWVQTGTFNTWNMMMSGTMGAFIGGISFGLGSYFDGIASSWFSGITNTTLRITTSYATSGLLTGGLLGAGMYCFNGAEGSFWDNVLSGAANGLITGGASGFLKGRMEAKPSSTYTEIENRLPDDATWGNMSPYERGEYGKQQVLGDLRSQYPDANIWTEVSYDVNSTTYRSDISYYDSSRRLHIVEVKSGANPGFTTNQKITIPALQNGARVVPFGDNARNLFNFKMPSQIKTYTFDLYRLKK